MSFSYKVKAELSTQFGNARHCNLSELSAFINICGEILQETNYFCVKIQSENLLVMKKCFTLLQNTFNINSEITETTNGSGRKAKSFILWIKNPSDVEKVLHATGIWTEVNQHPKIQNKMYAPVVSSICCRRAYVRGAFLCAGSVNNPEKNYHLEFVVSSEQLAEQLKDLINTFELDSKVVARKDHFVVYLKEGEQIVNLLNVMEAHVALMDLENVRIVKEVRNDVNRRVNCETANLNKIVHAAVKQEEDILLIQNTIGLEKLPPQLIEIAMLRLEYSDISLKELGALLQEPVGKSGVNHRLKKISLIAESLREGKGEGL
ncbi:DNA-binding protein WhiA [Chakrabartyella piscis]|uniref:DNA-binding protein WhiA n=1 Tax=Chakrabartyella piscis TaxID=2918914 RepID=UPI0029584916|nr:DNA-binding protein WhiA [Chakrabartyella piscis]